MRVTLRGETRANLRSMLVELHRPEWLVFPLRLFLLVCLSLSTAQADEHLRYAQLGRCPLQNGAAIADCVVAYRTSGTLDAARSNVLVFPAWYGGSTADLVASGLMGPGALADTDRYHVIAIEPFGNGLSSSPSNSTTQAGTGFPSFSIGDMVEAQYRLLREQLGLERVFAVVGLSMGGMQALEWMVRRPDYMQRIVSIEGTPWPSSYDLLLWGTWRDASNLYRGDAASLQQASELLARLDALALWTPEHFVSMVEPAGVEDFVRDFTPAITAGRLLDRRYQSTAILEHDIRRAFAAPATDLAASVRARTLLVVFSRDHMVNPAPSLQLARWIGAETRVLDSPCGHMGPTGPCALQQVRAEVRRFLENQQSAGTGGDHR